MAAKDRSHSLICPNCGWSDIRPAKIAGFLDHALAVLALAPYRCRKCRARFHRFAWFADRPTPARWIDDRQPAGRIETLAPLSPVSILLLDPDDMLRKLLARLLNKMGYNVREAARTQDALLQLEAKTIDLVIANMNDVNLNGDPPAVIRKLRNTHPELKILAHSVTESAKFSEDSSGRSRGRLVVLPKPSRTSAVIEGVRELAPTRR